MTQLAFLDYLEVDDSADERAIRRAYARKLKLIDQEQEAAAFQALREAYEVALQWCRWQQQQSATQQQAAPEAPAAPDDEPRQAVPEPPLEAPTDVEHGSLSPAAPAFAVVPPEVEARAVFEALMADLATMSSASGWSSDKVHREKLLRCLDDPRLLSIAARDIFEWFVAEILAAGWRPGHEALLVAASRVFCWQDDPRRLARFGWVGNALNRAITERAVFDQQGEDERKVQRDLIARLRDPAPPSDGELIAKMPQFEWLVARYPVWLPMIASMENLQRWRELDKKVPAWKRRLSLRQKKVVGEASTVAYASAGQGINWRWSSIFLVFVVVRMLSVVMGGNAPPPPVSTSSMSSVLQQQTNPIGGGYRAYAPGAIPLTSVAANFPASAQQMPERSELPPGKAQLKALETGKPNREKCAEIGRLTKVFKIGTTQALTRFSPAFERQVIACVNAGLWPNPLHGDPAIQEATSHEMARNLAVIEAVSREQSLPGKSLQPVARSSDAPPPAQASAYSGEAAADGNSVRPQDFKQIKPFWSADTSPNKYMLNPKDVQLKAKE
jgi:protein TonB